MSGPPIHSRSEIPRPDAENTRRTRYSVFRRTIINGIDLADQKKERNRQPPPRIYLVGSTISFTSASKSDGQTLRLLRLPSFWIVNDGSAYDWTNRGRFAR
jgi:hypothetical protein